MDHTIAIDGAGIGKDLVRTRPPVNPMHWAKKGFLVRLNTRIRHLRGHWLLERASPRPVQDEIIGSPAPSFTSTFPFWLVQICGHALQPPWRKEAAPPRSQKLSYTYQSTYGVPYLDFILFISLFQPDSWIIKVLPATYAVLYIVRR